MYRVGRAAVLMILVMAARPRASHAQADTSGAASPPDSTTIIVGPLGIPVRERALGVAHQTLLGAELVDAREPNIVSALAGKVAGADVTNNSTTNGSVHIALRGERSITGDDQPLFVVDGIPVDNSRPMHGDGGADYGNTVEDVDPNDIASVTVLTGANAAALYGSRAANGAILITTKTAQGAPGFGVSASQYVTFETPLRLPAFQNQYGQGLNGQYAYVDGRGGGVYDNVDESWGPPLDGRLVVQWRSNGQPAPWLAQPNNVRDFFDLGHTATTTAAVTAAGSGGDVRLGISDMDQHGMLPNTTVRRITTSLTGGSTMFEKLTTRVSLRYGRDDGHDRPATGYNEVNPMTSFIFGGRQLDLAQLRNYALVDGAQAFPTPEWDNNPYWDVYMNPNTDSRDHVVGVVSVSYAVTPWLSAMVRSGTDWYHDRWVQQFGLGDVDYQPGMARASTRHFRENNTDLLLSGSRDLTPSISLAVNAGAARRDGSASEDDYFEAGSTDPSSGQYDAIETKQRTTSAYGQAQLAYRNYLFLNTTGRNDWTSFGPVPHTSNFYPSVSSAFVFTDAVPGTKLNGLLSSGTLRLSWAQVGGGTDGLVIAARTTSWEGGLDLAFARDRLKVSGTYYDARTLNRLFVPGPPVYVGQSVPNMDASITSRGLELQVMATPLRGANFEWNVSINFAKDRSRVASLPAGVHGLVLGSSFYASIEVLPGDPYGMLVGQTFLRDSLGRMVVVNGLPVSTTVAPLGHYTPDWIGGIENQFRYKRFDLSVLLDTKQGGKIFSGTEMLGDYAGALASSLRGREHGETLSDGGGLVVPGVNQDGTPNTTSVTAQSYFNSLFALNEAFVYDASFLKLREVRLGYTVPPQISARLRLSSLRIAAIGRNLWLHAKAPDIDPEATFANGDGDVMEFLSVPSARSYGLVLNVTP